MVDFFLLGPPKAGTTSLDAHLSSHPAIATSQPKESRFFDLYQNRGLTYLETCFSHALQHQLKGDCSPQNLICNFVAKDLAETFPQARLMVTLREPTARAYSHWWMKRSQGVERRSFENCVEHCLKQYDEHRVEMLKGTSGARLWMKYCQAGDTRETPYLAYLEAGLYQKHIERYLSYFPMDQILVLSTRELSQDPSSTFRKVARFLEVDEGGFSPSLPQRNRAKGIVSNTLNHIAVRSGLDRIVPIAWKCAVRDKLADWGDKPSPICPTVKARVDEFYEPHNLKLRELLGRKFC